MHNNQLDQNQVDCQMDVPLWTEKCIKNNLLHYSLLKVNSVVIKSQR